MTSLIILIDGLGDDPIPAWNGLTPFDRSYHPAMDRLIKEGNLNHVSICEKDVVPGSLTCILRLLGVPKEFFPGNRAYLELLAQNRDISEYEMVILGNKAHMSYWCCTGVPEYDEKLALEVFRYAFEKLLRHVSGI